MAMSRPIIESAMDYKERVDVRLEEFVHYFVKEFEAKLTEYNLVLEDEVRKPGKLAETVAERVGEGGGYITGTIVGSLIQMPAQGAKVGTEAGRTLGKIIGDAIGSKHQKSKVIVLLPVIENWCKDKASFRGKLVQAGFDIFQSFEMQFMRVETYIGPKNAMKKLATDAVKRAFIYLRRDSNASISKSVILGESNKVTDFLFPGFEIVYKCLEKTKKWRTDDLYSKTGIVREISSDSSSFHAKINGKKDAAEYGFRRLLACEDWVTEEKNYPFDNIPEIIREEFTEYRYILNNENSEEKTRNILDSFNAKDEGLIEERIIDNITKMKEEFNDLNNAQKEMAKVVADVHRSTVPHKLQQDFAALDIAKYTYIPQTFQRHEHIKTDCLKADVLDIFAISNADVEERSKLLRQATRLSFPSRDDAMEDNISRIIVMDNEKEAETSFDFLCKIHPECNIHWLENSKNGNFVWKRTHRNLSNLCEFVEEKNITLYQPKKLDDMHDKFILVTGAPGIGKSTLLSHLQLEQEKDSGNLLHVYRINLIDYRDELFKEQFSKLNQVHEFLKKIVPGIMLEESALLFDGFDEICPRYEKKVISLLRFLKDETEVKKICVTSRSNMKTLLENELGVFSYILAPFSIEDQKSYLWRFWQTNLLFSIKLETIKKMAVKIKDSNNAEEVKNFCQQILNIIATGKKDSILSKIEELILYIIKDATLKSKMINEILVIAAEGHTASTRGKNMSSILFCELEEVEISIQVQGESYASKLLEEFHQHVRDNEKQFAGIPLQTRMLAEAFEDDFQMFYRNQRDKKQGTTENLNVALSCNFNLIDLYDRFVKRKCEIFYTDKVKCDLNSPIVQEALDCDIKDIDDYGKLAVATIFSEEVISFDVHVDDEKKRKLLRVGIVTQHGNKIDFIHRTFSEYFAASFMAIAVRNPQNKVVREFLHEHIFKESNEVIRYFFDRLLARKSVLHMAVLNADYRKDPEFHKITSLINANLDTINECDAAGRTVLHLASSYGHELIVQVLLSNNAVVSLKDKLFDWSALTYADKGRHLKVAELLVDGNANVEDMFETVKDIENYNAEKEAGTVLHIAARDGHLKLVEHFIQISKEHRENICKVQDNKQKSASDLLNTAKAFLHMKKVQRKTIVNAQDLWHFTPLHYAAQMGHLKIVKALLKEHSDIDARTKDEKFTPLHLAAQCGHYSTVNSLLIHGAKLLDAEVTHTSLFTVPNENELFAKAEEATKMFFDERRIANALFLIEHWCEKNASSMTAGSDIFHQFEMLCTRDDPYIAQNVPYKITPLHLAAYNNDVCIIVVLCLKDKASVNAGSPHCTPLMIAADHGFFRASETLIHYGAVVNDDVLYYALKNTDRVEVKNRFFIRNPGRKPNCSS